MNLSVTLRQTEHTFQDLFLTHGRNLVFSWTNGTSLSNASGSSHTVHGVSEAPIEYLIVVDRDHVAIDDVLICDQRVNNYPIAEWLKMRSSI